MKFYYKEPMREIRVVKPDSDSQEYEFYLLIPVRVGSAIKKGTRAIIGEEGEHFVNIQSAAHYYVDRYDPNSISAKPIKKVQSTPITVPGAKIAAKGKWEAFCRMRQLNESAYDEINKMYQLTHDELASLGLTGEEHP